MLFLDRDDNSLINMICMAIFFIALSVDNFNGEVVMFDDIDHFLCRETSLLFKRDLGLKAKRL